MQNIPVLVRNKTQIYLFSYKNNFNTNFLTLLQLYSTKYYFYWIYYNKYILIVWFNRIKQKYWQGIKYCITLKVMHSNYMFKCLCFSK